jgi:outer membrane receptor protein involved in Fe transport
MKMNVYDIIGIRVTSFRTGLVLLMLLFAVSWAGSVQAQVPGAGQPAAAAGGTLTGIVIDSVTKKPVDYATVSLFKTGSTTPFSGGLSDDKGAFRITNVPAGSYRLQVNYIGYDVKNVAGLVLAPGKLDRNLGRIIISPGANLLEAVQITGQQALIENKIDKLVFNAEKDVTSAGGNVTDILRKVPMVSVDMDGNVALRGSQNVRILINGKPSGALTTNAADVLKSMPSDQIKNVEVITSPSAKYDAEGSAGIINIITKKKEVSGVSGSVNLGIGTRQNNENANINFNKNKLSVTANVGFNAGWPQTTYTTFESKNTLLGTESSSNGESTSNRQFLSGSASVGYDFNDNNSFLSSFSRRGGSFKNDGTTTNSNLSRDGELINYTATNRNENSMSNFDWNNDFTHKFKRAGEEISISAQWTHGTADVDYATEYSAFTQNQRAENLGTNNEYTVQVDYVLPINKMFKVEAGAKTIIREIKSDYDFFNPNEAGQYVLNPITSNAYVYGQDVYAGYGLLTASLSGGYTLMAGARMESTNIDGSSGNTASGLQPFKNDYLNFIPSLIVSKSLTPTQTIKLSYSKRIQRPSLQFLNPFRNTSDPLNQSQGNPELSPEIGQTIEFNYSTFVKSSVINASVYYRRTEDIIESVVSTVPFTTIDNAGNEVTRDVSLSTFQNVGTNNSIGTSLFGSTQLWKVLTLRGNINAFTYKPQIISSLQQGEQETYIQYNAFVSATVKISSTLNAETFVMQNSARRTFQGTNPSFNLWVIGLKQDIFKKRGTLGLNITQPFKDYKDFESSINSGPLVQRSKFSVPFRSFGLNFAYNFGKMNYGAQPPRKKRGVTNDDLIQGGDAGGQGGGQGGPK